MPWIGHYILNRITATETETPVVGHLCYLDGLLESRTGSGGRGGLSGRADGSLSVSAAPSVAVATLPEALLLVEVLRRCDVRSVRLEERECSVL